MRDAMTYTEHAMRKTVTTMDVVYALKRQGRTMASMDRFLSMHDSSRWVLSMSSFVACKGSISCYFIFIMGVAKMRNGCFVNVLIFVYEMLEVGFDAFSFVELLIMIDLLSIS